MPVTHVLHKGPVKVLESEGWITRSLARSHAIEQANQCHSLSQTIEMVSIYADNGGNNLVSRGQTAISPARRLSIRNYKRLLIDKRRAGEIAVWPLVTTVFQRPPFINCSKTQQKA